MSNQAPIEETFESESTEVATQPSATMQRYRRYKSVIDFVSEQPTIQLDVVKEACQPEQPQFITRVIRELEKAGWLVRLSSADSVYRWNEGLGDFPAKKWLDERIFGSQIANSPTEDRPRERLLSLGAAELKLSELFAILIRSGRPGQSAVQAGELLANQFQKRLAELPAAGRGELKEAAASVDVTAYCQIMAGIELGRRVASVVGNRKSEKILSSSDAIKYCEQQFARLIEDGRQEEFHIVTLNTKNSVIGTHLITRGTLDASLVHPREVFKAALKDSASSIILLHNHPSGDPTPSKEDLMVTKRLEECGQTLGIDVLDHIVLGSFRSVSIREYR